MMPRETLSAFDRYLAGKALRFEGIFVGGSALNLVGVVSQSTKDCDILYPIPDWPAQVRATLADLGERLGHAL